MAHVGTVSTTKRAKPNEAPMVIAARERLKAAAAQSECLKANIPGYGRADVVSPPTVLQRDIESMNTVHVHYPGGDYDVIGVRPGESVDFRVKAHVEYRDRVHCHYVGGPPLPKDAWRVCLSDGTRIDRRLTFQDLRPERGALDVDLFSEQSGGSGPASEDEFVDSDCETAADGAAAGRSTVAGGEAPPAPAPASRAKSIKQLLHRLGIPQTNDIPQTIGTPQTILSPRPKPTAQQLARRAASLIASVQDVAAFLEPILLVPDPDEVCYKLHQVEEEREERMREEAFASAYEERECDRDSDGASTVASTEDWEYEAHLQNLSEAGMEEDMLMNELRIEQQVQLEQSAGTYEQHLEDLRDAECYEAEMWENGRDSDGASTVDANKDYEESLQNPSEAEMAEGLVIDEATVMGNSGNDRHQVEPAPPRPSSASSVSSSDECAACDDGGFLIQSGDAGPSHPTGNDSVPEGGPGENEAMRDDNPRVVRLRSAQYCFKCNVMTSCKSLMNVMVPNPKGGKGRETWVHRDASDCQRNLQNSAAESEEKGDEEYSIGESEGENSRVTTAKDRRDRGRRSSEGASDRHNAQIQANQPSAAAGDSPMPDSVQQQSSAVAGSSASNEHASASAAGSSPPESDPAAANPNGEPPADSSGDAPPRTEAGASNGGASGSGSDAVGGEVSGAGAGVDEGCETEGANDEPPTNSNGDALPRNVKELLHKIIFDPEYGILSECGSAIATPAMTAWNRKAEECKQPQVEHKRGESLPEGFFLSMPPKGLPKTLAPCYHLIEALARQLLITEGRPLASVPFKRDRTHGSILQGKAAHQRARLYAVEHLTPETLQFLRAKPNPQNPNFEAMQQLWDAGIHKDPTSQMPIFNPCAIPLKFRTDLWKAYCGIAVSIDTKGGCEETCVYLDQVKDHLRAHCSDIQQTNVEEPPPRAPRDELSYAEEVVEELPRNEQSGNLDGSRRAEYCAEYARA